MEPLKPNTCFQRICARWLVKLWSSRVITLFQSLYLVVIWNMEIFVFSLLLLFWFFKHITFLECLSFLPKVHKWKKLNSFPKNIRVLCFMKLIILSNKNVASIDSLKIALFFFLNKLDEENNSYVDKIWR